MTRTHDWGSFEDFFTTAMAQPDTDWRQTHSHIGLTGTAVDGARAAVDLIAVGELLIEAWRFGILHTVDTYDSARRRGGTELAAQVFAEEPPPTGSIHVDAAFATVRFLSKSSQIISSHSISFPSRNLAVLIPLSVKAIL